MSGVTSTSVPGVNSTISPGSYSSSRASGTLARVERGHGLFAHGDDELGVHDGELAAQVVEALGLGLRLAHLAALDDVGAVELQRVDLEPLAALHERRAGAPEERDAFVAARTGRAWYLSRKMSAMGWPEPITGMVRAWLHAST